MTPANKQLIQHYVVEMLKRSEEYNLDEIEYVSVIDSLRSFEGEVSEEIENALTASGLEGLICNSCEQEKFFDVQQETFYCPVCIE